jgi:hypothetical protein
MVSGVVAYSVSKTAVVSELFRAQTVPSIRKGGSYGWPGFFTEGLVFELNLPMLPTTEGIINAANPRPTIQTAYFLNAFIRI